MKRGGFLGALGIFSATPLIPASAEIITPTPGDIIILRSKDDHQHEALTSFASELRGMLRARGQEPSAIAIITDGMAIEALDEGTMRKFGWVRAR